MTRRLGIVLAGLLTGFGGMAFAHDMAKMNMAQMSEMKMGEMAKGAAPARQLAGAPAANAVAISGFAFAPATLTVPVGTTVTWINQDEEPHTVTSATSQEPFRSDALDTDDKFSFTFAKPGTYKYFCAIHPHMVGTVVVQ
jgi:plastocyanin